MGASLTRELFVVEYTNAPVPGSSAAKSIPTLLPEAPVTASSSTFAAGASIDKDISEPVADLPDSPELLPEAVADLPDSPESTSISDDLSEVDDDPVILKNTDTSPLFTGTVLGLIAAFPFFALLVTMAFLLPSK